MQLPRQQTALKKQVKSVSSCGSRLELGSLQFIVDTMLIKVKHSFAISSKGKCTKGQFNDSQSSISEIFFTKTSAMRLFDSVVQPATCGETTTFGSSNKLTIS